MQLLKSLKAKITLITSCVISAAMLAAALLGVFVMKNIGNRYADQILYLLCRTGEKNLDHYFESVEQSVEMVSAYVEEDLKGLDEAQLHSHMVRAREIFKRLSTQTNGIVTYYYRIDPSVSATEKGFWYVNLDGGGFVEHEVTDITRYDTEDTSKLVWFTVPKATGEPVWLPPYVTDNLDTLVISYNEPIYCGGVFVGVVGIEIDYSTMAEEVNNITLFDNGYAFINDKDGSIIYHPRYSVQELMEHPPKVPDGLLNANSIVSYTFEGVEKRAVWMELSNGMRLNVAAPVREINGLWTSWVRGSLLVFLSLLALCILFTMHFTKRITEPLRRLTEAAREVDAGNYDVQLEYDGKDEIGSLTRTFRDVTSHLKDYINGLNDLAYADALTSLHNKGAFDIYLQSMQSKLNEPGGELEFAICIFDCNNLKQVNDQNGHDKGDVYIKQTVAIICEVFDHSPVFRIGGDEFAAIVLNEDFRSREALLRLFDEKCAEKRTHEADVWEQVDVARGMAVYDPAEDSSISDVVRRADKLMYENKWLRKRPQAPDGARKEPL